MAVGTGVATITFADDARSATLVEPAKPKVGSNEAKVTITGQTGITSTSAVEAFIMGSDSTSSHNSTEHQLAEISVNVENIVAGVGFDIVATSKERLTGSFKVRYVWGT